MARKTWNNEAILDPDINGTFDWAAYEAHCAKAAVRVATTANGTLASAFDDGSTVDGVILATGDRILLKNQSTGAENGIYTVAASGAPTRATDMDADAEVTNGAIIYVKEGTTNGAKFFYLSNTGTVLIGTTALTFAQVPANPMTTLGDTLYGAASGVQTRLAGNTTTTKKYLTQTGDGAASAAPGWNVIAAADIPTGVDAAKLADGTVSNAEFQYIGGLTSDAQTQLNAKQTTANLSTNIASDTGSNTKYPSVAAVETYIGTSVTGVLDFQGATDASANPNYPAATQGHIYVVSVAGKVGGASGKSVDVGDMYLATATNAGGTEAAVGTSWTVLEHNLVGAALVATGNVFTAVQSVLGLKQTAATELTIATGAITATQGSHKIDTEADAGSDDLDTINGLTAEMFYVFRAENTGRTVVFKHGTGNIYSLGGTDTTLDNTEKGVFGYSPDGTKFIILGGGSGAGASAFTDLTDTFAAYTGLEDELAKVNSTATGLETINADEQFYDSFGNVVEDSDSVVSVPGSVDGTVKLEVVNATSVTVKEEDGTPTGIFDTIKFPNGSLTNNGDGSVSVDVVSASGAVMTGPTSVDLLQLGIETPAQITANTDDYPLGSDYSIHRLSSDASRDLRGFSGWPGLHILVNVGSNDIVIKHQVGTTAAFRVICHTGADITLAANESIQIFYDPTTERWRTIGN